MRRTLDAPREGVHSMPGCDMNKAFVQACPHMGSSAVQTSRPAGAHGALLGARQARGWTLTPLSCDTGLRRALDVVRTGLCSVPGCDMQMMEAHEQSYPQKDAFSEGLVLKAASLALIDE